MVERSLRLFSACPCLFNGNDGEATVNGKAGGELVT